MSQLLLGLLGVLVATNQPAAVSNLVAQTTGISITVPDPNDPVEKAYQQLLEDDDAAAAEVDKWLLDEQKFAAEGAGASATAIRARILDRLNKVRSAYDDFLLHHPRHARARLAYSSFLDGIGEEEEARAQAEKSLELDAANPATYNNLANFYGHKGPVKKAFEYYAKAIELNPTESVYYRNLATTVYLFRKDAREYYEIDEQQVFDKALGLYRKALELDPANFLLAADWASSYYAIKPPRNEEAIEVWSKALKLAGDEVAREGVQIHLARFKINLGAFDEARAHLALVTNEHYSVLKQRVSDNLQRKEEAAKDATPAQVSEAKP